MIKIGKIELDDWVYPKINGIIWPTPYKFPVGFQFDGSHYATPWREHTLICLNCYGFGSGYDVRAEFYGELRFLTTLHLGKKFSSYENAMEQVDIFLRRMSVLTAFI